MPIYQRKGSPHWWVRISIAGQKTRKSTGTADYSQAEEYEQKERERLWRIHKLGDRGALSWKEATIRYLADSTRSRVRDRQIINDLAQYLDNESIADIDADGIGELRRSLLFAGKATSTVDRYMRTLRAILRSCAKWQIIPAAPAIPMYGEPAAEPRWITHTEFNRLIKEVPAHIRPAAIFAVQTGLRHDSMLALTWDRIDLRTRRAWVPGSQMKAGNTLGIPLNEKAMAVLKQLKRGNKTAYVFTWKGKPLKNCNTRAYRKAVARAGLTPLRWHDLRHTFASWAVQSGVTLHDLMQLGGWKSYAMVLRYSHLSPDHLAAASAKIAAYKGSKRARIGHNAKDQRNARKPKVPRGTKGYVVGRVGLEPTTNALKGRLRVANC